MTVLLLGIVLIVSLAYAVRTAVDDYVATKDDIHDNNKMKCSFNPDTTIIVVIYPTLKVLHMELDVTYNQHKDLCSPLLLSSLFLPASQQMN